MSAAAAAAAAAAASSSRRCKSKNSSSSISSNTIRYQKPPLLLPPTLSRYEDQKRRDWDTFRQYLNNHRPPLSLSRCSGDHILEFLRYIDQFGKTKVHTNTCPFFGHLHPPAPCPCPFKQSWASLEAFVSRLGIAFEEKGGDAENNPFDSNDVKLYLRKVRDNQAKARGT
ncbi:unnamed protein product [Ilex paraguariensis]|uniref:ALOG domain-containing protein n=1 Tax=Ilex paraguariensis TaxID=185542 RepID=A0ABC8QUG2_9AQUA